MSILYHKILVKQSGKKSGGILNQKILAKKWLKFQKIKSVKNMTVFSAREYCARKSEKKCVSFFVPENIV